MAEASADVRIAVISDVHGNLLALEAVLADIRSRGADLIVNLGDCVTSPLWPRETFERLDALRLPTVRGNHDRGLAEIPFERHRPTSQFAFRALSEAQRAALGALPPRLELIAGVLCVHGTPTDDATYLAEDLHDGRLIPAPRDRVTERLGAFARFPVVLCGHSHRQYALVAPGGALVVNPGSVGCPLFADGPNARSLEPRAPHARYAIVRRRCGRWAVEMHALDYDWDAAARRARAMGSETWAEALTTGAVSP